MNKGAKDKKRSGLWKTACVERGLHTIRGFSIDGTIEKDGGCATAGSLRSDRRPILPQAHRKENKRS